MCRKFITRIVALPQSLLSQGRRRAMHLLARFLDMGTWAVRCALEVGVYPYLLRLLKVRACLRLLIDAVMSLRFRVGVTDVHRARKKIGIATILKCRRREPDRVISPE